MPLCAFYGARNAEEKGRADMKLFMQQEAFAWGKPLELRDKGGHTRYVVTGDAYSLGKRLHVQDAAGREAVYVRQRVPSMFPRYELEVYGKYVGSVIKDLTFLRPRYTLEGLDWEIGGNPGGFDFEITWRSSVVASCHPVQGKQGALYALELLDRTMELPALGVLLTVSCILAPQGSRRPG